MNERELCMPPRLASLTTILIEVAVDPYASDSSVTGYFHWYPGIRVDYGILISYSSPIIPE
jgi:hypothetical protein